MFKKATALYLTLVILIDFMGVATVVTLFPHLLIGPHSLFPSGWSSKDQLSMMGVVLAIYPLGQFFGASLFGKLSDHYGRKQIMFLTLLGTCFGFLLSAISIDIASAALLFMSRLIAGLCAGNVAIAQASLIDVSRNEAEKTRNISYGQIAMGSAYIVGPVLGALLSQKSLISWFSASTPFWFFTIVLVLLIIATKIFYHETLLVKKEKTIQFFNIFQNMKSSFCNKSLKNALIVWMIFVTGWWLFESYMPTYLFKAMHFNTLQIGCLLAFNGALYSLFQYAVVQRLAKKLSPKTMVRISLWLAGVAIISVIWMRSVILLYTSMSVFVVAMGFAIPGLITCISNLSDAQEQGKIMGVVNSIQALSTVIVMLCGGYIDSLKISITVFFGGLLVIASWVAFIQFFGIKNNMQTQMAESVVVNHE